MLLPLQVTYFYSHLLLAGLVQISSTHFVHTEPAVCILWIKLRFISSLQSAVLIVYCEGHGSSGLSSRPWAQVGPRRRVRATVSQPELTPAILNSG